MRIITDTPDLLEIRSDASAQRIVSAVMVVVGMGLVGVQLVPDAEPSLPAYIIGSSLVALGSLLLFTLRSVTLHVDTKAGKVVLGSVGLASSHYRRHAIGEIGDAELEEKVDTDDYSSFRLTFVLRDGIRVPFTTTHSPDYDRTATIADAVRRRVLKNPTPRQRPRGKLVSAESLRREGQLIWLMLAFASLFLAAGVHLASLEQRSLRQFEPVTVTVLDVSLDTRPGEEGGVVRRPAVTYSYAVDGVAYRSDRVTPLAEWREGGWATDITRRFAPGQRVEGYYDPSDPSRAYLLRRRSALPLVLIAIPLFGVLLLTYGGLQHMRG